MKVAFGCSALGACVLITLTLQSDRIASRLTAASVAVEWRRFLYRLKKSLPNLAWMKVTELTKAGIPHLHLVMGNLDGRTPRCQTGLFKSQRWREMRCAVVCLEHEIARAWFEVTGDSWVVDCRAVVGAAGAGAYLGKYLGKDFGDYRGRMEELGFARRYNRSHNWPHVPRMEYEATVEGKWEKTERRSQAAFRPYEVDAGTPEAIRIPGFARVGTEMAAKLDRRKRRKIARNRLRSWKPTIQDVGEGVN